MTYSVFVISLLLDKIKFYEPDLYDLIYKLANREYIKFKYMFTHKDIDRYTAYIKYEQIKKHIKINMILKDEEITQWNLFQKLIEKIIRSKYTEFKKHKCYSDVVKPPDAAFLCTLHKKIIRKNKYPYKMLENFCNFIIKRYDIVSAKKIPEGILSSESEELPLIFFRDLFFPTINTLKYYSNNKSKPNNIC